MKVDSILFDLDGTLWDATQAIAISWAMVLENAPDVPVPPSQEQVKSVMGMTPEPLMATLFPTLSKQRRHELFEQCCQVEEAYIRQHGGQLYPQVEETLKTLSQRLPLFIVSNCNSGYIPCFLEAHHLGAYFKDWECVGRTGRQKWENIQLVCQRNHLSAPVYVGDTALDQESAQKAGVPFLHADYGFGQVENAPQLHRFSELLELFPN